MACWSIFGVVLDCSVLLSIFWMVLGATLGGLPVMGRSRRSSRSKRFSHSRTQLVDCIRYSVASSTPRSQVRTMCTASILLRTLGAFSFLSAAYISPFVFTMLRAGIADHYVFRFGMFSFKNIISLLYKTVFCHALSSLCSMADRQNLIEMFLISNTLVVV